MVLPNHDERRGPVRVYSTQFVRPAPPVSAITWIRPRPSWIAVDVPKMLRSAANAREARHRSRRVSSERSANGAAKLPVRCAASDRWSNR